MRSLNINLSKFTRLAILVFLGSLFVSACSGSSDSQSAIESDSGSPGGISETDTTADNDATNSASTSGSDGDSMGETPTNAPTTAVPDPVPPQSEALVSTRIDFDITVPAYQSNALQVRLQWWDKDISAQFVVDESWTVVDDFPVDTENELIVTFNDDNGAITLGSFEQTFRTGTSVSESFQINADQFDTERWDSDGDGVSNLDELIAGNDPTVAGSAPTASQPLLPVQANLELVQDKTYRISWQPSEGAEFYRVLENPDGLSGFSQIGDDIAPSVQAFNHRVALYKRFNASYVVQTCNASICVDSSELIVSGTLESAVGYFKANNPGGSNAFGGQVSISADGNTLAVGATGESSSATTINGVQNSVAGRAGAVYIFVRNDGLWQQQSYLKASNAEANDLFGASVSLSADGNTVVVGALQESSAVTGVNGVQGDNSAPFSGAAYVFVRSGELWQLQAYLKASNTGAGDNFGADLSLSADGNTLPVGATEESSAATGVNGEQNDDSERFSGAVYIFVRGGVLWQQQAYLKASNSEIAERFGNALSLSTDGNTLAVGGRDEDSAATGINGDQSDGSAESSGAVYIFVRNNDLWQQQAYLKASNTESIDLFGGAVSLNADGSTLAVGATQEDSAATGINGNQNDNTASNSGAVYVFVRNDGLWQQQAYLKASNTDGGVFDIFGDAFGNAVSLSADGNTLAVGASREDSGAAGINGDQSDNAAEQLGAVYVFIRNDGIWQQLAYVKSSNPETIDPSSPERFGRNARDSFGGAVNLSADGNTLVVGARAEESAAAGINGDQSDNSLQGAGAVYIY